MRWAEECRAHTESLPTPISGEKGQNINTPDLVSAVSAYTLMSTHLSFIKTTPTCVVKITHTAHVLTNLQSLYSELRDCSAPLRSSVPAAGHWPRTAVGERAQREGESENVRLSAGESLASAFPF